MESAMPLRVMLMLPGGFAVPTDGAKSDIIIILMVLAK